jgi:VWFA-related protein
VVLDIVVRDRQGRLLRDLKPSEFEVYEDGVRQRVDSFFVVSKGAEADTPPAAAHPAAAPLREPDAAPAAEAEREPSSSEPTVLAFVFDRLSAQGRNLAEKAALAYLTRGRRTDDLVGVFSIDLALHTIQPFTSDPALIRDAVNRAARLASAASTSSRGKGRELLELDRATEQAAAVASRAPVGGQAAAAATRNVGQTLGAGAAAAATMAEITLNMLRSFESLERDQQGFASTNGLLAVVRGLQKVPGRKTVVLFSEGLAIPAAVQAHFSSVVHSANRANVTIYAMDAGGLRAESPTEETRREIEAAADQRLRLLGKEDTAGALIRELERNEDLLRLNPHSGLGQLADQTGGFLIRDTNDAAAAFRQIGQDMRFHYVLGYTPSNQDYDGRFRTVAVKVRRPGADVHSRKGYFAVHPGESSPLLAYEAPAVALLDHASRVDRFPIRAAGLSFPEKGRPGLVPVLVEVPGSAITYAPEKEKEDYGADLAVVVRVKNEYQQEIQRLSQHYVLSAAEKHLEAARKGDILFYRETDLPPGHFTLEAVAYDAVAYRASIRTFAVDVPPIDGTRPRLSSLVLVRRVEPVPEAERNAGGPLYYGETVIYPNLGQPFRRSSSKVLGLYFTVCLGAGATAPAGALIQVFRDGHVVGQATTELAAPDSNGRIQHVGTLPLERFAPGSYELRVSLMSGTPVVARSAPFTVEE